MKFLVSLLILVSLIYADRCTKYIQEVRKAHYAVFGTDFPYWYAVGQLQQESNCRNILSNDGIGSQGLAQITYKVWKNFLKKKGIPNINTTKNQLHAQAFIMADAKRGAYSSHLWVAYQIYNGGYLVNKEIKKARIKYGIREVPHNIAREFCKRKIITFNSGYKLDACEINYDYSVKIYKYSKWYNKLGTKTRYIFW